MIYKEVDACKRKDREISADFGMSPALLKALAGLLCPSEFTLHAVKAMQKSVPALHPAIIMQYAKSMG